MKITIPGLIAEVRKNSLPQCSDFRFDSRKTILKESGLLSEGFNFVIKIGSVNREADLEHGEERSSS